MGNTRTILIFDGSPLEHGRYRLVNGRHVDIRGPGRYADDFHLIPNPVVLPPADGVPTPHGKSYSCGFYGSPQHECAFLETLSDAQYLGVVLDHEPTPKITPRWRLGPDDDGDGTARWSRGRELAQMKRRSANRERMRDKRRDAKFASGLVAQGKPKAIPRPWVEGDPK